MKKKVLQDGIITFGDGSYLITTDPDGLFGMRRTDDRNYWMAWASSTDDNTMVSGVMDDFGTLVETYTLY